MRNDFRYSNSLEDITMARNLFSALYFRLPSSTFKEPMDLYKFITNVRGHNTKHHNLMGDFRLTQSVVTHQTDEKDASFISGFVACEKADSLFNKKKLFGVKWEAFQGAKQVPLWLLEDWDMKDVPKFLLEESLMLDFIKVTKVISRESI